MLDFIGGLLDNPARGVGINPDEIDPSQRWAMRGMTLQALGNQLQGGTPFYQSMQSMAQGIDKRALEQAALKQQQQVQATLAQPANGAKERAEQYRRVAQMVAAANPEAAQKYMDIADKLDPAPEYGAPVETATGFVQPNKYGGFQPMEGLQPKPPTLPTSVQEYRYGLRDPAFATQLAARDKAKGTNVIVNSPGDKKFLESIGAGIGDAVVTGRDQALAAQNNLATIEQIRSALPKAITGPGADARMFVTRLQTVLGVGGKDDAERLANTAQVMQGLAQAELNAAQQMKGQGQITEAERAIIRRAAGGDISMTPHEITALMSAIEKVSLLKIKAHEANLRNLENVEGASTFLPFFRGGSVGAPEPAGGGGAGNLQDAARQELQRRQGAR